MTRRAVITGIGLHTPLGDDLAALHAALLDGRSAVVAMPAWAAIEGLGTHVAAPVPGFDGKHLPRTVRRTMGRVALLAASAAQAAVTHAGLDAATLQAARTAVVVGSTAGSGAAEEEFWSHLTSTRSSRGLRPTLFFQAMAHTCAANVALLLGLGGEVLATNSACASSSQAIGVAAERIRLGKADVVVAGGAEELHVSGGVIFDMLGAATRAYNDRPGDTPRPFDAARDGIVVGEGAGIVVVEELEHALRRGATVLAEVSGYATTCDAAHMTDAQPDGMMRAIRGCLRDAGVPAEAIDYVNAHATGTRVGDAAEATALHDVFGDRVPVSSSKGHLGHTLGACGVIEAAICVQTMRTGILPPTRGLRDPDVAPIRHVWAPQRTDPRRVLSTNFAFGGVNSVLLLTHPDALRGDAWS